MSNAHRPLSAIAIAVFAILFTGLSTMSLAQELVSTSGKVRVFKGGLTIEGRDLQVNDESVSLTVGGQPTFIDLRDIDRVDVRRSNVMKGACIGGGGCAAIGFIACAASSEDDLEESGGGRGQCFLGAVIWSALFAGGGALMGSLSSNWDTIYYRTRSGLDGEVEVGYASRATTEPTRVGVAIVPPRDCCGGMVGVSVRF